MSKPIFTINNLGAQNKSAKFDSFLTKEILEDISMRIFATPEIEINWKDERNVGRLITCEYMDKVVYITLSPNGIVQGRNCYFQSVCTAAGKYLQYKYSNKSKNTMFGFYFLPCEGNNLTEYHKFMYRIMVTAGINIINPDYGFNDFIPMKFNCVKDIINQRNELRDSRSANKSTYITDEGDRYHIYGKTFGANQKETTLMCLAMARVTDKPIELYQIVDNDSKYLSNSDMIAIERYVDYYNGKDFKFYSDTESSLELTRVKDDNNDLRSPKFIYNLLDKYDGKKRCALCECNIERIIQAAHIFPIADIKKRNDLSFEQKFKMAIDRDNGIWLCENHHKLFDSGLIWFKDGHVYISQDMNLEDIMFIKKITTIDEINPIYINDRVKNYFDLRAGLSTIIAM